MSAIPISSRRKRAGGLAALALASIAAWYLMRERPTELSDAAASTGRSPPAASAGSAGMPGGALAALPPTRDVIAGVVVEPETVCVGSEALVRVQVAQPYLDARVSVAGSLANPAIVRAHRPGERSVRIVAYRDGARIAHTQAVVKGVDCGQAGRLVVAARRRGPDRVEGLVVIARGLAAGPRRWDFGDGTVIETEERSVAHQYAFPTLPVTHIVSVTAADETGDPVTGRAHFTVMPRSPTGDASWEETAEMLAKRNREQAALRAQEGRVPDPSRGRAP